MEIKFVIKMADTPTQGYSFPLPIQWRQIG